MVLVDGARQYSEDDALQVESTVLDKILGVLTQIADTQERIQQQLAKINEGENLRPGDRHYDQD